MLKSVLYYFFKSRPDDLTTNRKCQRALCRCNNSNDCAPYKPERAIGPLVCCQGVCLLGPRDGCNRRITCT